MSKPIIMADHVAAKALSSALGLDGMKVTKYVLTVEVGQPMKLAVTRFVDEEDALGQAAKSLSLELVEGCTFRVVNEYPKDSGPRHRCP